MKNRLPEILLKVFLGLMELVFVGLLCALRVANIGWLLIIFGLGLVVWVLLHLGLMTAFIVSFKLRLLDIALYLAIHFFYLWAWLFQSDGGDTGGVSWTIQKIHYFPALDPFLEKNGDALFWGMSIATFGCYLLLGILLVVRLVRTIQARNKSASVA
jgi:hypothetical protein